MDFDLKPGQIQFLNLKFKYYAEDSEKFKKFIQDQRNLVTYII